MLMSPAESAPVNAVNADNADVHTMLRQSRCGCRASEGTDLQLPGPSCSGEGRSAEGRDWRRTSPVEPALPHSTTEWEN